MMVIFDQLSDAQAYVAAIDAAMGYPLPGDPPTPPEPDGSPGPGWTVTWDIPRKSFSEPLWAVSEAPVSSGVPFPEAAVDILAALPSSWYPPPETR